jgi:apolipoprotein N-acyltransferase
VLALAVGPLLLPSSRPGSESGSGLRVAVLQTAVPVEARRDPMGGAAEMAAALDRLLGPLGPGSADLVVLPETAFPLRLEAPEGRPFLGLLERHAARLDAPILAGGFGTAPGSPARAHNSVFLVGVGGVTARYHKRRLVPVIERTPLAGSWLLRVLGDSGSYAVGDPAPPIRVGAARVAPLICFESAFASLARAQRRAGATLFVNATNDAWFGSGLSGRAARAQHEAHLVLRAIESGAPVVRVANGGRSAWVDTAGRLTSVAPAGEEAVAVRTVPTAARVPPAVWTGGWVGPLAALATMLRLWRGRRASRSPISMPFSPDSTG